MLRALLFLILVVALALIVLSLLRRMGRQAPHSEPLDDAGGQRALPPPRGHVDRALSRETVTRLLHELALDAPLEATLPAEHMKIVLAVAGRLRNIAAEPRHAPRRPPLLAEIVRDADTGTRSSRVAEILQPSFRGPDGDAGRFGEIIWEHAQRSAAAAEAHAAAVESSDAFAAQLAALVMGVGAMHVYRQALEQYGQRRMQPEPAAVASLLEEQAPQVARQIAASWGLPDRVVEALDERREGGLASSLGRSLEFGLLIGALGVLRGYGRIDEEAGVATLAATGVGGDRFARLWARVTWPPEREGAELLRQS